MSYGTDTWALGTLRTGRLATGNQLVAQACYRRLTTPRGALRGSPDAEIYGLDLSAYVGAVGTAIAVAALPSLIGAELRKDDRVSSVATTIAVDGDALTIEIEVTPADEGDPFTLTLAVDAVDVSVLGVS